jgi:hypothetical protein
MRSYEESSSRPPIDLAAVTENTRRTVYDVVVAVFFDEDASHSPEEAGLAIYHFAGRWFALWLDLEAPSDLPEEVRRQVVRIRKPEPGEQTPGGYGLRFDEA